MRRSIIAFGIFLLPAFLPRLAPAVPAAPAAQAGTSKGELYHFCRAGAATRQEGTGAQYHVVTMPLYMSDVYPVPVDKDIRRADSDAFARFLAEKYDPFFKTLTRACGGNFSNREAAQAYKEKYEDQYRKRPELSNKKVIETGWKWAGAE